MKKMALLSFATVSILMAGGYRVPESSLNCVALGAANIAHNHSADAAYYNPANMVFMEDIDSMEVDLTYIGLDKINYESDDGTTDIDSKSESFFIPTIHYVSGKAGNTRIGLSIVTPGGLSKRWDEQPAKSSAEEFTLQTLEINPSVAIPVNDKVAFAFGFRAVYSSGIVKASYPNSVVVQDMNGDSFDYGYNLALAYKPTNELEMGLTYRSQVNLTVEGDADLVHPLLVNGNYASSVTVLLPAVAGVALAYTLPSKTTVEFVYERTMWSAYNKLDFDYDDPTAEAIFGRSKDKNWKDTNTYRLGITQELDKITLMGGLVYDETPVPEKTIGFELPDSNSFAVSLGGRYKIDKRWDVGVSALYSMRQGRDVKNSSLDGEFSGGNVLIVSSGIGYKF
jgi:long-chain fatty acid transport protein